MSSPGARTFRCRTDDGVDLRGVFLPGPHPRPGPGAITGAHPDADPARGDGAAGTLGFVVAHGFTHATYKPATRRITTRFARHGCVAGVDFRGHGRSAGRSSVGRDEVADLDAAVRYLRTHGARRAVVVGFSMGAAVALRHAALGVDPGDAVVSVSAPARWYIRDSAAMRRVQWLMEHPAGPAIARLIGVRLSTGWDRPPSSPIEVMSDITRPTLLVQGTADAYFALSNAELLWRASGESADLWVERGMGHGETATTPALVDRIAEWARAKLSAMAPPSR